MGKRGKKNASTSPAQSKLIAFPSASERWLHTFQAVSPAERCLMLPQALNQGPELEADTLRMAFATVSQMLTKANRYDEQQQLAEALRRRSPDIFAEIQPVQNLMQLQQALFSGRLEAIPDLIASWIALRAVTPVQVKAFATRLLVLYGQTDPALALATGLAQPPTEAFLREHLRILEIENGIEQVLRQQAQGQAVAWDKLRARLQGLDAFAFEVLQQRLSVSESASQIALLDAFESRLSSLTDWALIAFARWMLAEHGLSVLISSDLLGAAWPLWDAGSRKRSLAEYVTFTSAQLERYLTTAELEPLDTMLLLWGLPYVYDWLVSADFCPPGQAQKCLTLLGRYRQLLRDNPENALWGFAFFSDWPAPYGVAAAEWAAEVAEIRADRERILPLSEHPGDSAPFDADWPDVAEAAAPADADFDALLGRLASQDEQALAQLEALLGRLSPEQMERLQAFVLQLEFGAAASAKPASTRKSKSTTPKAKASSDAKTRARRPPAQGDCQLCGATVSKPAMVKHLESCHAVHAWRTAKGKPVTGYLLRFRAGPFWLYLLARPEASLADVDTLLRDVWLECCGHLSAFTLGGREYQASPQAGERGMKVRLDKVLPAAGISFDYEYDFGSTTELVGQVIKPLPTAQAEPVGLLARNVDPQPVCETCGAPATVICSECSWSGSGLLCQKHRKRHACGQEMLLPVVNSPRCGVCGYTG